MLARIRGRLESVEGPRVVVDMSMGPDCGMAREALVTASLAGALRGRVGEVVTLHTMEWLESTSQGASFTPRLLGFGSPAERRFFELFTTVKGVGTKKALRAMAQPPGRIARAIFERDVKALQELPEIGKRLAETIALELHGKVEEFLAMDGGDAPARVVVREGAISDAAEQALAALVRLGESRADAERMVRRVMAAQDAPGTPDEILAAAFAARGA